MLIKTMQFWHKKADYNISTHIWLNNLLQMSQEYTMEKGQSL